MTAQPTLIMPPVSRWSEHNDPTVNVLIATFAGLGLPRTLNLQMKASQSIGDAFLSVFARLPCEADGLILSTVSNKQLLPYDEAPISTLLGTPDDKIISLRLNRRLCGGKGGFGSQLRAAGGRMSSRKNRDRQENLNGLSRNLDGRRLRTIDEAKRLADYLAIKPEMEQREKETRRKRWEAVVEAADKRESDIKSGRSGANQGRLDAEYVESKEAAEEKTREAVFKAMRHDVMDLEMERTGSESSKGAADDSEDPGIESSGSTASKDSEMPDKQGGVSFFGWDDDEEDEEDEEEDDEAEAENAEGNGTRDTAELGTTIAYIGKGKAKAF